MKHIKLVLSPISIKAVNANLVYNQTFKKQMNFQLPTTINTNNVVTLREEIRSYTRLAEKGLNLTQDLLVTEH